MNDPTVGEIGWLLGGRCGLTASGILHWHDENQNYVARLALKATGIDAGAARFVYRIGKLKSSEPTLLITYKGTCVYRLDVNQTHRHGTKLYTFVTHIQRRRSLIDQAESFEPNPVGVPRIDIGKRVTPRQYRDILSAFAAPIGLDILDITWTDPPEGRQP
ncbi:hypothetical protein SEA_TORTELLINI_36 [Mycobacterium phage Tortellini]|uniref:Uncharacterized protein n=1 Tax=Mycobacterium phage Tortellini TaxID=1897497 RepID=A0A1D8EX41_9CAUD|nr:hypothetical protein FDH05_gp36 [Mycobacterium phage Tortellini]AOT25781.1 hypothetical protein SEA_TORTELLINI_36 [Mycobacterium phage Tortellini]